jgi:hypothetical protein
MEDRANVPLTLELAETLIAGLAVGDSDTETKWQGEQQTPTMPSDQAHALLHEAQSSSANWYRNGKCQRNDRPARKPGKTRPAFLRSLREE